MSCIFCTDWSGMAYAAENPPSTINQGVAMEATGVEHYTRDYYDYSQHTSYAYGDENTFLGYQNRDSVKNTVTPILRSINLFDISDGNFLYYRHEDDMDENYSAALGNRTYRKIFWGDNAANIRTYPDRNATAATNALVGRFTDAKGNYVYKVLGTVNSADDAIESSAFKMYVNQTVFSSLDLQEKLYAMIGSGNKQALRNFIDKYIPHYYLVTLTDNELAAYQNLKMDGSYFADNSLSVTQLFIDNNASRNLQEITADTEFWWGQDMLTKGSEDKTTHTYDSVKVDSGARWTPLDRTVSMEGPDLQGTYAFAQAWGTGTQGTMEEKDMKLPPVHGADGDLSTSYDGVISPIPTGSQTAITVKDLTLGDNSTVDLSYANTVFGRLAGTWDPGQSGTYQGSYTDADGKVKQVSVSAGRTLFADTAVLGKDVTFRLGIYGVNTTNSDYPSASPYDSVYLMNAKQATPGQTDTVHIQLGWVPGIGQSLYGAVAFASPYTTTYTNSGVWQMTNPKLLGIYQGSGNFTVVADTSYADGIDNIYQITPDIGRIDNYFATKDSQRLFLQNINNAYIAQPDKQIAKYTVVTAMPDGTPLPTDQGQLTEAQKLYLIKSGVLYGEWLGNTGSVWYLKGYTYVNTGEIGESGKEAVDQATAMQNLWREQYTNMFRRTEDLHARYRQSADRTTPAPAAEMDGRENVWASAWHGRFESSSDYGRSVSQSYNGLQVGYDKLLNKEMYGGKVYTGLYVAKLDSSASTEHGKGDPEGTALGIYGSWVGDSGRYFDMGITAARLEDKYHFTGPLQSGTLGTVSGDYSTWAYGLGMKYGKRNEKDAAWTDPHVSMFIGHMDDAAYKLDNGLKIGSQGWDSATGSAGITVGKKLNSKGQVWAGAAVNHEFAGGQKIQQSFDNTAGWSKDLRNPEYRYTAEWSQLAGRTGGGDTWYELSAGGDIQLTHDSRFHAEYARDIGKREGNSWNLSGRLDVAWAGFGSGNDQKKDQTRSVIAPARSEKNKTTSLSAVNKASASAAGKNTAPIKNIQLPRLAPAPQEQAAQQADTGTRAIGSDSEAEQAVSGNKSTAITGSQSDLPASAESGQTQQSAPADVSSSENDAVSFSLPETIVEARRLGWEQTLSPGQVSVIYPKQFEGEQKELPELLDRIPGLFIDRQNGQGHYTTARIRGSQSTQVDVYVDGVKMNLNGDAAVNLSAIPADNIERIEVYRGYVPARFAGAPIGGVINIVTKKPNSGHGNVLIGTRSFGGWNNQYEYSMPLGNGSLLATFSREVWDGDYPVKAPDPETWKIHKQPVSYERTSNDLNNSNGMIKWQDDHWMLKTAWKNLHEGLATSLSTGINSTYNWDGFKLGFTDAYQNLNYHEFYVGRHDDFNKLMVDWHIAYMDSNKHYRNTGAMKMINWPVWPPNDWGNWGHYQPTEGSYMPGQLWGDYHSKKWNANFTFSYNLWDTHLLELNTDMSWDDMNVNASGQDASQERLDYNSSTGGTPWRQLLRNYHNRDYHVILQDTMKLDNAGSLKLTSIGRADKVIMQGLGPVGGNDDRWMYSSGTALQKKFNDNWDIKTSWGTYQRHPNFYELFGDGASIFQSGFVAYEDAQGYKNGTWETGTQFDFGVEHLGKMGSADTQTILTWFQRKANNQLVLWGCRRPDANWMLYIPTGLVETHGIELTHNMKWKRVGLSLAGTWETARGGGGKFGDGNNFYVSAGSKSFVPEWVWSARLDYTFPGDRLSIFSEYHYRGSEIVAGEGSADMKQSYAIAKDSYATVDLGMKYRFKPGIMLTAGVNDIANRGYNVWAHYVNYSQTAALDYPLMGRNYYVTMQYSF
ncbi:MAG: TonB-dependent receptor [Veillonellales bacterium]